MSFTPDILVKFNDLKKHELTIAGLTNTSKKIDQDLFDRVKRLLTRACGHDGLAEIGKLKITVIKTELTLENRLLRSQLNNLGINYGMLN